MSYEWDLNTLYSKKENFYLDMTIVRDKIKKLSTNREIKIDGNSLYDLINECFNIREINSKTLLYASLNYYLDINNDSFIKMKEQAEELDLFVLEETSFIDELIAIIDYDKFDLFYEECPDLKQYQFYINNVKRLSLHNGFDDLDKINLNIQNINKNIINYNKLFKDMDFGMIKDISLNNSNIGEFLTSNDRDVRNQSFININNSYKNKASSYFNIFNEIVLLRNNNSKLKKYNSVLEEELDSNNLKIKYIDNLINSVNSHINLLNNYLKLKCDYLDISNPTLADINVSFKSSSNSYSLDNAFDVLKDVFSIFGSDYLKEFNYLKDNNHLDLICNDKKHPSIVFSWNTYSFMNYRNRYIDIKNLAHELGHIINYSLSSKKEPFVYKDSDVFVGEVASLVNEILLNDYLYTNACNKDDKIFYLTKIIENFISQVYRQTMYTEFENIVYNSKKLSLDLLNNEYLSLIKKYYSDSVLVSEDSCFEWMRVGHLFRWSYYVYKYASGYILAFNVVKKLKEKDFIPKYIDFLSSGSSCSNEDLLKKLGINLYDEKLINDSFDLLESYISQLKVLLDKEK